MDPKQFIARFKSLVSALAPAQLITIGVSFLAVVALIAGSAYWLNSTSYQLLFSDLDAESAADVVARLRAQKVKFQIDPGGHAVRVPADKVDELRLDFAGKGMPVSGRIGFELFDRTAFGATEFQEQVNYKRALEGELARTIATISEVAAVRVHIALPKNSLFAEREQPAKASVVLKLRNGNRPLSAGTASGIAGLVAAGVEGLRPESVVIIDNFGRPLFRPADPNGDAADALQLERQQRLERELSTRVVALLEPVVGQDRVRVNVSARLNPQSLEQTEERWDPNTAAVRSRQTQTDGASSSASGGAGIAGSRGNLPPPSVPGPATQNAAASPAPPANNTQPGSMPASLLAAASSIPGAAARGAETTNYEISRSVTHTVRPQGDVARLSVAVLVDNEQTMKRDKAGRTVRSSKPRKQEEIQKLQAIVAAAVGLDTARGDQLTVENIPFDETAVEEPPAPSFLQQSSPQIWDGVRIGAVVLLGLIALLFVFRPIVKRATAALPAPRPVKAKGAAVQQLPRTVEDLQNDIEAQLQGMEAKAIGAKKITALTKRVTTVTQQEPENAARLIRSWLAEEEGL